MKNSDVDEGTDSEEEAEILGEERQTLFTSLKSRIVNKNNSSSSNKNSSNSSENRTVCCLDAPASESAEIQAFYKDRGIKGFKRTSDIVDLSFSDDEIQVVKHQPSFQTQMAQDAPDDLIIILGEEEQGTPTEMSRIHSKEKQGMKCSSHDSLRGENLNSSGSSDDEDMPSFLPSMLWNKAHSSVRKSVNLSKAHESAYFETQTEDCHNNSDKIPKKKRKRSPEEIAQGRQAALVSEHFCSE